MSIRFVLTCVVALACACLSLSAIAHAEDLRAARSEEHALSSLAAQSSVTLNETSGLARISFDIAPGARAEAVELVLVARPVSPQSGGRLQVSVNRGRSVTLAPQPENFEARFALYADSLREGRNTLNLNFDAAGEDGWVIDAEASRLRVSVAPAAGYSSLSDVEAALGADFAAPRRIFIDAGQAGTQAVPVSALTAQGLALRMGEAPILVSERSVAELTVRAVADPAAATPAVTLTGEDEIQLSATDSVALIAAARLFAARSMDGQDRRFGAAQALSAARLVRDTGFETTGANADLETLAGFGAPFGAEQGIATAVVFTDTDPQARLAALAVVGRAAIASGSAWIYGWFGEDIDAAPASHHRMVLGPLSTMDSRLLAAAPAEMRAATDAARARLPRQRRHFGSTAYADDTVGPLAEIAGIAAIYEDTSGQTVAIITSPDGADFARAARRLARSSLWNGMEGQAVLWDASAVTAFGPTSGPAFSREAFVVFLRDNDRYVALGAFSLAMLLLLSGSAVNRSASRRV